MMPSPHASPRTGRWIAPVDHPDETPEVLLFRYEAYCERQAAALLHLMPREAVRPLYARARTWARERGLHETRDPMATLLRYARLILPLPPFEVWLRDRQRFPLGHVEDASSSPFAPDVGRPGVVEVRDFRHLGVDWNAALNVFRDGPVWRGFVCFDRVDATRVYRTANIFCESTASEIRERFLEYESDALKAFLSSTLP